MVNYRVNVDPTGEVVYGELGGNRTTFVDNYNQEPFDANVFGVNLRIDPTQLPGNWDAPPDWMTGIGATPNAEIGGRSGGQFTIISETKGDGTVEGSETWAGTGPESLFNAESSGYVGDQESGVYDQAQPGTSDSSDPHGPPDNIRGHWRLQIGADNDIDNQHEFSITNATANGLDLEDDNVLSVDNSRTAITAIDHAIDEINRERSYIGSEQSKLQFTMSNLTSNIQSIESSRSSIEDADFAAEAADLAKNQILAQSATAMLAQASAIPQNILSLLR